MSEKLESMLLEGLVPSEPPIKKIHTYDSIMAKAKIQEENSGQKPTFEHISTYCFARIENPREFQQVLKEHTKMLVGTVIVSFEGLNLFLCGLKEDAQNFKAWLGKYDERFQKGCWWKDSPMKSLAYRKSARIRLKKEIVTMGIKDIDPTKEKVPYISPIDLQKLLEEHQQHHQQQLQQSAVDEEMDFSLIEKTKTNNNLILLDTRNEYECRMGTFNCEFNRILPMKNFKQFPTLMSSKDLLENKGIDKKNTTVITYCTGGIRCEKGAPLLKRLGFDNVFQLEGGILKYFHDVPKEKAEKFWKGECFVFDRRVCVDFDWQQSKTSTQCFVCREPLTLEEQNDPAYIQGTSCKYCINKTAKEIELELQQKKEGEGGGDASDFLHDEEKDSNYVPSSSSIAQQ